MLENRMIDLIEKILSSIEYKYICKMWVDPEMDDDVYWVNVVFNSEFMKLRGEERLFTRSKIAKIIEDKIQQYLDTKVYVGSTVDKNC